jgi:hypothetical protein
MKKFAFCVVVLGLFCSLASCAGKELPAALPTNTNDSIATIVAATLTAMPSPTAVMTPTSLPKLTLDDFQDKQFVGEDSNYSIYLVNRTGGVDAAPTGNLLVYNKITNQVIEMNGQFTVIIGGGTIVYDDGKGKTVLLSIGTYTSRNAVVLSLNSQRQAVSDFCMSSGQYGDHLFWNDYIIINNCDTFTNRPWGAGEAPGVIAINLETGTEIVIAKSDLTHQFQIKSIEDNNLQYIETYVENGEDWKNQEKQKTEEKTYDLLSLSSK